MSGQGKPAPPNSIAVKIYLDLDLIAWMDKECESQDRTRTYFLNQVLRGRMKQLEARRKKRG